MASILETKDLRELMKRAWSYRYCLTGGSGGSGGPVSASDGETLKEKTVTITDFDLQTIETEQMITDMDLRLMTLEV